jgi:exopolysaccharide production protein ExoZ
MVRSVQSLRAVAALLVVYFHAVLQVQTALRGPDNLLHSFGSSGVDLFFVISGFVMWTSTAGRALSTGAFYRRRIVRIVPLYWGVTLFACAVAIAMPQLLRTTKFEFGHALASFLFIPWPNPGLPPNDPETLTPVVIPGWTLNYEMFFYALFGMGLLVEERRRFIVVAMLIGAALVAGMLLKQVVPPLGFYGSTLLFEFLAGVFIGSWMERHRMPNPRLWAMLFCLLLPLLCILDAIGLHTDRALQWGTVAALIIFAAVAAEKGGAAPHSRLLETLGDASYSIYLTHVFVIAALRVLVNKLGLHITTDTGEILFVGGALILSAGVGFGVYRLFEVPATRYAGRLLIKPSDRPRRTQLPRAAA